MPPSHTKAQYQGLLLSFDRGHPGSERLINFRRVTAQGLGESFCPHLGWRDGGSIQVWCRSPLPQLVNWS